MLQPSYNAFTDPVNAIDSKNTTKIENFIANVELNGDWVFDSFVQCVYSNTKCSWALTEHICHQNCFYFYLYYDFHCDKFKYCITNETVDWEIYSESAENIYFEVHELSKQGYIE